jgi:hypothetical protein
MGAIPERLERWSNIEVASSFPSRLERNLILCSRCKACFRRVSQYCQMRVVVKRTGRRIVCDFSPIVQAGWLRIKVDFQVL